MLLLIHRIDKGTQAVARGTNLRAGIPQLSLLPVGPAPTSHAAASPANRDTPGDAAADPDAGSSALPPRSADVARSRQGAHPILPFDYRAHLLRPLMAAGLQIQPPPISPSLFLPFHKHILRQCRAREEGLPTRKSTSSSPRCSLFSRSLAAGARASSSKLLKETCSYIRSLQREVDDLSGRLAELMSTMDSDSPQAEIIRSIFRS
ncbi:hypothetical protein ZIOFF_004070 [Zingiber officinale]|uniref:BHLH domain-containing protein n=1 Tax=Zingiber officinale TaxID=94328 RepID=A0A8J5IAN3_ZINOF|nr:hypothetical protein ZIOFF_004070 [Zingiber officinale]